MDPVFGAALTWGASAELIAAWHAGDIRPLIDSERVAPLLVAALVSSGELVCCPVDLQTFLKDRVRAAAASELLGRRELKRVVAALAESGVAPLLFKGAALAYTWYRDPACRPREDTDLIVRPEQRGRAEEIALALGYERAVETDGRWITQQVHYERTGACHALDIHQTVFNPQVFAGVLPVDEMLQEAAPIEAIPGALAPSRLHSLLIAAVHRIAHHDATHELLWLYDITLLCAGAPRSMFDDLVEIASLRKVASLTGAALKEAVDRLGASVPRDTIERLRVAGASERTARYLDANLSPGDVLVLDMRALPGWGARLQAVGEHLFPPRAYIAQKYGLSSPFTVSLAYVWRIVRGAPGWVRRSPPRR